MKYKYFSPFPIADSETELNSAKLEYFNYLKDELLDYLVHATSISSSLVYSRVGKVHSELFNSIKTGEKFNFDLIIENIDK